MKKDNLIPFFFATINFDNKAIRIMTNNSRVLNDIEASKKKYPNQVQSIPNVLSENIATTDIPSNWIRIRPPWKLKNCLDKWGEAIRDWFAKEHQKKCTPSTPLQKSESDFEERYLHTDADAPYTAAEIQERFWELWVF